MRDETVVVVDLAILPTEMKELQKCLAAVYLATEASIADDINRIVRAAIKSQAKRIESSERQYKALCHDYERVKEKNATLKEEIATLRAELERRRQQRMSSRLVGRPSGARPDIPVQAHLLLDLAAAAGLECEQEPDQILLHAIRALTALRATADLVERALRDYVLAQSRMADRWAEGDDDVKRQLWKDLHFCEACGREALEALSANTPQPDTNPSSSEGSGT